MVQHNACPACGGNAEYTVVEGMVQYKCPYCGYVDIPREMMHDHPAAMTQKFRFLTTANDLYAEILNKIASPQSIRWPEKLLSQDVNTFLSTPIYGMLYAAWLTKGFHHSMTPDVKAVIRAVYEPAVKLKNRSAVLAVLINLYENSINEEKLREKRRAVAKKVIAISAAVLVVIALVTSLMLLKSHAPALSDQSTNTSIQLTKDSLPMFKKLGISLSVKEHPSTSARYVDVKSVLAGETETFSVLDLTLEKSGEARQIDEPAIFTLAIPDGYDTTCLSVYFIDKDKSYALIPSTVSVADNSISFSETRFGTYAIAERHPIVSFDTNGGSAIEADIVKRDTLIPCPEPPTKVGYNFAGWFFGDKEWNFTEDTAKEDMTLVAKWSAIEYYVSFNANGGSPCDDLAYTIDSDMFYLPIPSRPGYQFVNWYTDSALKGKTVTSIPTGSMGDMELYAKWKYATAKYTSTKKDITIDASYTKVHDTFSLDAIAPFLNSSYNITFTIEILMYEKYAGYQEIYLCDNNQAHVWKKTNYEYGGSGSANSTASWVTFTCTIPGNKCTSIMNLMYGANGDYSDDWVRSQVKVTATVTDA